MNNDNLYVALVSFTTDNMQYQMGGVYEFTDEALINDLLQANYIEKYVPITPDLSDYIKYDDYATPNRGGVITAGYGFNVNTTNGKMSVSTLTEEQYQGQANSYPISKGTLDMVVGEFGNALDETNGEVI